MKFYTSQVAAEKKHTIFLNRFLANLSELKQASNTAKKRNQFHFISDAVQEDSLAKKV